VAISLRIGVKEREYDRSIGTEDVMDKGKVLARYTSEVYHMATSIHSFHQLFHIECFI